MSTAMPPTRRAVYRERSKGAAPLPVDVRAAIDEMERVMSRLAGSTTGRRYLRTTGASLSRVISTGETVGLARSLLKRRSCRKALPCTFTIVAAAR